MLKADRRIGCDGQSVWRWGGGLGVEGWRGAGEERQSENGEGDESSNRDGSTLRSLATEDGLNR